jgi:hypothetical protein
LLAIKQKIEEEEEAEEAVACLFIDQIHSSQ